MGDPIGPQSNTIFHCSLDRFISIYHGSEREGFLCVNTNGFWVIENDIGLTSGSLGTQFGQPNKGDGPVTDAIEDVSIRSIRVLNC